MDEIAHWLLAQLYNGVDLAVPWWPVRYTAYVLTTAVTSAFLARMLWKRVFSLQFRLKSDRVSRWWTIRLGTRLLRAGGARPGQDDIVRDRSRMTRACLGAGRALAPAHLSRRRLERHASRALAATRVLEWGLRTLSLVSRWNTIVCLGIAASAVVWLRPPWITVPGPWHRIVEMYDWITVRPLPSVLGATTALVAVAVIISRGGLLDRLRYREESTRGAVRHLNELLGTLSALAEAAHTVRHTVADTIDRSNLINRAVAEASRYSASWNARAGRPDYEHAPSPTRFLYRHGSSTAAYAVDEAFDRVAAVLREVAAAGLGLSAERLLRPVLSEAIDLGLTNWSDLDDHRLVLGSASASTDWEKRLVESLKREFDQTGGGGQIRRRILHQQCLKEARKLDNRALGNILTRHHIEVICRYLRRRQGGDWATRFAMAFAK